VAEPFQGFSEPDDGGFDTPERALFERPAMKWRTRPWDEENLMG
jgi:hypothetical protein